jgi:putative ABC transport system permease protein
MEEDKPRPPRFPIWFLSKICPVHLYEEIEGDLIQRFYHDVECLGKGTARQRFVWNVIRFFRPGIVLRNRFSLELNQAYMFRNYLKIAYRHLMKSKTFSLINIVGLTIGITAFLLIVHYVRFERSYEDFHKNASSIYRVALQIFKGSEYVITDCEMYSPVGPMLKEKFPEVEDFVRVYEIGTPEVKAGDRKFYEEFVFLADASIMNVFTFEVLQGDTRAALSEPSQVVMTEAMANKYFGSTDVIGESIEIRKHLYKITAVVADSPANTHLKINFLLSHSTLPKLWDYRDDEFRGNNEYLYLLMAEGANLADFNEKLKHLSLDLKEKIGDDRIVAESLKDIHLYSKNSFEPEPPGNAQSVYFLMLVACFIVMIAWINYINLSTARAAERAREVGIRKVMGSLRTQLIFQFLSESIIVTVLAAVLSLVLVYVSLPLFIDLAGQPLPINIFHGKEFWNLFIGLLMAGSLAACLYPAFVLSSFQPVMVLKGRFRSSTYGQWLRRGLVVFQFASTVVLTVCMGTVYFQVKYLKEYDLGMDIEQTLVLRSPTLSSDSLYLIKTQALKKELMKNSSIQMVTQSGGLPGLSLQGLSTTGNVLRPGQEKMDKGYIFYIDPLDENFIPAFHMQLAAGRNFEDEASAVYQLIINEEAMHALGFPSSADAVGAKVLYYNEEHTIIGVLKNFYQQSPKEKHIPMIFYFSNYGDYFSLRIKTGDIQETIAAVKATWDEVLPDSPLDYFFLDETFNKQYKSDQRFERVMGVFSVLAVVIACMGLFGLSSFTIIQRTREIGIRKVLGASAAQVVQLLSMDYVALVLMASVIALPVAYFAMEEWLSHYAVRIAMSVWMFTVPIALILLISLITVSFQTVKAAHTNPVDTLKCE